jgi:hypothetical protein
VSRNDPKSWRKKVHPAFIDICKLRTELAKAQKTPLSTRAEEVQRVVVAIVKKRYELLRRYPELSTRPSWAPVRDSGYTLPSPEERSAKDLEWIFFKRSRTPLVVAREREAAGDLKAHEKIVRAKDDLWKLKHGYRVAAFKVNEIHSDLIEIGLNLGLGKLTAEELADCFTCLCPCSKSHTADALKKQRRRVEKQVQAALENTWRQTPPRERFSVFGAGGYIAKPYRPSKRKPYVEISRRGRGIEYAVQGSRITGYSDDCEFRLPEVFSSLPAKFFLRSAEELFRMFFPAD